MDERWLSPARLATALAVAASVSVACVSDLAATSPDARSDVDAAMTDGGQGGDSPTDAARDADGGPTGCQLRGTPFAVCETFDDPGGAWVSRWTLRPGDGALGLVDSGNSLPFALQRIVSTAANVKVAIERDLFHSETHARIEMKIRLDSATGGDFPTFTLGRSVGTNTATVLVTLSDPGSDASAAARFWTVQPYVNSTAATGPSTSTIGPTLGTWSLIELDVDVDPTLANFTLLVNGVSAVTASFTHGLPVGVGDWQVALGGYPGVRSSQTSQSYDDIGVAFHD